MAQTSEELRVEFKIEIDRVLSQMIKLWGKQRLDESSVNPCPSNVSWCPNTNQLRVPFSHIPKGSYNPASGCCLLLLRPFLISGLHIIENLNVLIGGTFIIRLPLESLLGESMSIKMILIHSLRIFFRVTSHATALRLDVMKSHHNMIAHCSLIMMILMLLREIWLMLLVVKEHPTLMSS